ncbi:acyl-CoA carboxylase epsilon subunit [Amycolatopsis sp. NBC_00438]|uniref:acyl-CoA carboxylase epsilon subunit n=1 Tax=Amycolatopsis sp. NBC_00438 TaxID=2903558 RepID=UPI002E239A6D
MGPTDPTAPGIRVVRGLPDDAELAALIAALLAASAAPAEAPARSPWADPAFRRDTPLAARQGAWRLSGLPR